MTVELRDRTPAEAVLGVLEGLGLNYALVLDATGTEVETLMIVGAGARAAAGGRERAPRSARPARAPHANRRPDVESDEPPARGRGGERARRAPEEQEGRGGAKPTPPPVGPLNPAGSVSPFAPGLPGSPVQPVPSPTPAPTATPSPSPSS